MNFVFIYFNNIFQNVDWVQLDPLRLTYDEWVLVYSHETKSLLPKYDTNIICNKMMNHVGCVINIKATQKLKNYIVIRVYCSHKYTDGSTENISRCRKYKIHLNYLHAIPKEDLLLEVWREDVPVVHLANKTRELRGTDRKQIQDQLKIMRPEILQRKIGFNLDMTLLHDHKNLQQYKTTAVFQKASEERRHAEDRDPNMVCKYFVKCETILLLLFAIEYNLLDTHNMTPK